MHRTDLSTMDCPVARTAAVVGDAWTVLVLRDAYYGVRRFEDFQRDLGIARNVLADRLSRLVDHGVLERRQYLDRPPRFEYRLTPKGRDLLPVVLVMMRWGDRWTTGDESPPVTLTHRSCDHTTVPAVTCSHCGDELRLGELSASPVRVTGAAPASSTLTGADATHA